MTMRKTTITGLLISVGSALLNLQSQVAFIGTPVSIGFDATLSGVGQGQFAGLGFSPSPVAGELDSDAWAVAGLSSGDLDFGDTQSGGDYGRGTHAGGVSTGGLYAFQVGGAGDVALGWQATSSDMTPGSITLKVVNGTGGILNDLQVGYEVETFNNADRSSRVSFSYSLDDSTYTALDALDFVSPEAADGAPSWSGTGRMASLSGLSWANGDSLYLRWDTDDAAGGGSRDELAIDNIALSVPEPEGMAVVGALLLAGFAGFRRRRSQ